MYNYGWQIKSIRRKLDDGGFTVTRINNKLSSLEDDVLDAIEADSFKFKAGDLDCLEVVAPTSDSHLISADSNLYRELDELEADILEEEMKKLQELLDI